MSQVYDCYAQYYDLLYKDKDYASEVEYVESHIRKDIPKAKHILELGCGTGAHAEHLARMGYTVHGVDMSEKMLARAEKRKEGLPSSIATRLSFGLGDVRSIQTGKVYDVVISLFHVMSYQISDNDVIATFDTAQKHLSQGGLFLFDFWYDQSVLTQRPEVRVKRLQDDNIKVIRIAEPVIHSSQNVVDVNYTVFINNKKTNRIEEIHETHKMRYFSLHELECFWKSFFEDVSAFGWMTDCPPDSSVWAGFQKLKRI